MKRVFIISLLLWAGIHLYSQPVAGKLFAGGSFSISNGADKNKTGGTTVTNNQYLNYSLAPKVGYFLSNKLAIGGSVGFSGWVNKYPNQAQNKTTNAAVSISPFARYYLISGNLGIFAEAQLGLAFGTNKTYYTNLPTVKRNSTAYWVSVAPGVYYYVSPKVALEAMVGNIQFFGQSQDNGTNSKSLNHEFSLNASTSLSLGFTVIL